MPRGQHVGWVWLLAVSREPLAGFPQSHQPRFPTNLTNPGHGFQPTMFGGGIGYGTNDITIEGDIVADFTTFTNADGGYSSFLLWTFGGRWRAGQRTNYFEAVLALSLAACGATPFFPRGDPLSFIKTAFVPVRGAVFGLEDNREWHGSATAIDSVR